MSCDGAGGLTCIVNEGIPSAVNKVLSGIENVLVGEKALLSDCLIVLSSLETYKLVTVLSKKSDTDVEYGLTDKEMLVLIVSKSEEPMVILFGTLVMLVSIVFETDVVLNQLEPGGNADDCTDGFKDMEVPPVLGTDILFPEKYWLDGVGKIVLESTSKDEVCKDSGTDVSVITFSLV